VRVPEPLRPEEASLHPYETLLLIDARRDDVEIEATINAFASLITERGGEIGAWDKWGRRKLAYEIEKMSDGYYAVCTYDVPTPARAEIEAALPFVEGLVRTKTVRRDYRTRGKSEEAAT
jgi:small subunit ribosomal protein S6